jgi:glycosyltransferase involved in cell wall biosynthesis
MISVLLPFRNVASTLHEAMASTLADLGPDDELVVINDGSSDASAAVAGGFAAADGRIVRLTSGTPERAAGVGGSLAQGLAVARGTWIARMDGDDVTLPGRFAAQRALLEGDAALGAVGVRVEGFPAPGPGMLRYLAWQASLITPADHARAVFCEAPLCHPSTMLRRAALDAVGGWRENEWSQDYDLWLRLDAAGYRFAKVPEVLFRWRIQRSSKTWTDPRNSLARLLALRAMHLARRLAALGRPFLVWGAGQTGKRLARALETHAQRTLGFVDIDPAKIGRTARGVAIASAAEGIARATAGEILLVVAVGQPGARDQVRARLDAARLVEGRDYVCAA